MYMGIFLFQQRFFCAFWFYRHIWRASTVGKLYPGWKYFKNQFSVLISGWAETRIFGTTMQTPTFVSWLALISLGIISGRCELRVCLMILCMMEWILHCLYLERHRQTLKIQWWKTETSATLAQWHSIISEDSVSRSHISLPRHFCPVLSKIYLLLCFKLW